MFEKRRWFRTQPRGLVARTGKILPDAKTAPIDCTVVDLSAGGACLELSRPQDVPKRFEFLHGGVRRICNLVWRRGFRVGISFLASTEKSGLTGGLSRASRDRR